MNSLLKESSQFLNFWLGLGEKSKMQVHDDQDRHIKLAMLRLAGSNNIPTSDTGHTLWCPVTHICVFISPFGCSVAPLYTIGKKWNVRRW